MELYYHAIFYSIPMRACEPNFKKQGQLLQELEAPRMK